MKKPKTTEVQTILFEMAKWTVPKARAWLKKHKFKTPKVDTRGKHHRFMQEPAFNFQKGTFRTIPFGKGTGIKTVIARPKKASPKKGNPKKAPAKKRGATRKTNPQLRLPNVLLFLGKAVELAGEGFAHKWKKADGMILFCNAAGTALYLLRKPAKRAIVPSQMTDARSAREPQVTQALKLYKRFHEFESLSGSIISEPKGTFKTLGRADTIVYASDKWSGRMQEYIHEFKTPPIVKASNTRSPAIVAITGGNIRITARGIEG